MKSYQKLYQLKQIVKADAEVNKYQRLTRKLEYDPIYDKKLSAALELFKEVTAESKIRTYSRLLHIAYSLLKNKTYDQIECSVKPEKQLEDWEWKKIVDIMQYFKDEENKSIIPTEPFTTTTINYQVKKEETNE